MRLGVYPKISLCMIVKDEQSSIDACLKSVQNFVHEIIIVDTGSSDHTVGICKKYGSKIYTYHWNDHFADARNFSISLASGDWILWLDADETLDHNGEISKQLAETEANAIMLPVINYSGQSRSLIIDANDAHIICQPRLFRNDPTIKFQNRIHETLVFPKGSEITADPAQTRVHHYGYLREEAEAKQKGERNMRLLKMELENPERSPWIEYHIASEHYRDKRYDLAFQYVNQSIVRFLQNRLVPPPLLYKLKYGILVESDHLESALLGIDKAISLYPDYVDLTFYKGYALYKLGKYEQSIEAFERCLELGEHFPQYVTLKGTGSFRAWRYIGECYDRLGHPGKAKEAREKEQQARNVDL